MVSQHSFSYRDGGGISICLLYLRVPSCKPSVGAWSFLPDFWSSIKETSPLSVN